MIIYDFLDKENNTIKTNTTLEEFGYMVLELTNSRRKKSSQDELIGILKNRILPTFKRFRLEDIKPIDIVSFLEAQKKEVCNDRVRRIKNPVKARTVGLVDLSYTPKNAEAYATDEISLILKSAKGWFKIFMDLTFKIGLRSGEYMALKWEDFDLKTGRLYLKRSITKGISTEQNPNSKSNKNHFRAIQLLPKSLELLKIYYEVRPSDEWLFINREGRYYRESKTIVDYHLKPLLKTIGIKYRTLYSTRRSYASVMSFGGENLEDIQKVMGHAKGSKITEKHYIDPRILKLEHDQTNTQKQQDIFNMMI